MRLVDADLRRLSFLSCETKFAIPAKKSKITSKTINARTKFVYISSTRTKVITIALNVSLIARCFLVNRAWVVSIFIVFSYISCYPVAYAGFFNGWVSVTSHRDDVIFSDVTVIIMPQRRKQLDISFTLLLDSLRFILERKGFTKTQAVNSWLKIFQKNFSRPHFWAIGRLSD